MPVIGSMEARMLLGGTGCGYTGSMVSESTMEQMMEDGTWQGGQVIGMGYVGSEVTATGSMNSEDTESSTYNNDILVYAISSLYAAQDNTKIDQGNLTNGGNTEYDQNGGVIITGNGGWEPGEKARNVDPTPIDMSWSNKVNVKMVELGAKAISYFSDPTTNLQGKENGDTIIWMDGGYWNGHPVRSTLKISDKDTIKTNNYHYPSREDIIKYGD